MIKALRMPFFSNRKFFKRLGIWILISVMVLILFSNLLVKYSYSKHLYSNIDSLPGTKVGLLLGTSKYLKSGLVNPYYQYRIQAAYELYKKGKIKYIIVSGDNRKIEYNEPVQMKEDLIRLGIDTSAIILDYAGFRTLDSVIRAKEIFGQNEFIIISQEFHNQRAIFIARQKHINAVAYNTKDVDFKLGLKVQFREVFARVKLIIDLFLINKQPKFLGEKIEIGK